MVNSGKTPGADVKADLEEDLEVDLEVDLEADLNAHFVLAGASRFRSTCRSRFYSSFCKRFLFW